MSPFTGKNWIDGTTHEIQGPSTTAISSVGLGDLETRVTDYTDDHAPAFSVKDYGATGDGVTDDTDEIQAAVDAASAGDTIYFPKGVYFCAGITPKVGVNFRADGGAVLKLNTAVGAPIFVWGLAHDGNETPISDVTWDGLSFQGVTTGGTPGAGIDVPIAIRGGYRLSVLNCYFYDFYYGGPHFTNCRDLLIRGNRVENCCDTAQGNGIHVGSNAAADIAWSAPYYGRAVITDNICVGGTTYNATAGICVQTWGTASTNRPHRTVVANNVCENWNWAGIYCEGVEGFIEGVQVFGNAVTNCDIGIGVADTDYLDSATADELTDTIIANNMVRAGTRTGMTDGIHCRVSRALIADNVVEVNGDHCLTGGGNPNTTPRRVSSDQLIANNIFIQEASTGETSHLLWTDATRSTFQGNQWRAKGSAAGSDVCFSVQRVDGIELKGERVEGPFDSRCLYFQAGCKRVHIHGCTIRDFSDSDWCITLEETSPEDVTITDNLIVAGTGNYGGIYLGNFTGSRVMNNVFEGTFGAGGILDGGGSPKYADASGNKTDESTAVGSAGTITLPLGHDMVRIGGTADITSITASWTGRRVTLVFTDTAATNGIVDGSNLKLASTLAYTPDDTITLVFDGTNWQEVGRSVN